MVRRMQDIGAMDVLKQVFMRFDSDGSGSISLEELKQMLNSMGDEFSEKEIMEMLQEVDIDGSGEINFEEFAAVRVHHAKLMNAIQKVEVMQSCMSTFRRVMLDRFWQRKLQRYDREHGRG